MNQNLRHLLARGCAVVSIGAMLLGAGGCGRQPSAQNPIANTKMQDYDKMMKSGGMRPAASTSVGRGSAPMVAPRAGMPGAPGMMPGAPGTGTPMTPTMAHMVQPSGR